MEDNQTSAVLLEGEKSEAFSLEQGMTQSCSLSPILFSVFITNRGGRGRVRSAA